MIYCALSPLSIPAIEWTRTSALLQKLIICQLISNRNIVKIYVLKNEAAGSSEILEITYEIRRCRNPEHYRLFEEKGNVIMAFIHQRFMRK
jgi:hypothetical protein